MAKGNKFGIAPVEVPQTSSKRTKEVGPMGAAVREAASHLVSSREALVEQRRLNAAEAKELRSAREGGRLLERISIAQIQASDLPRDRLQLDDVSASSEMEELKASIRARGQKDPIVVYSDARGGFQLINGWRRLSALRQLFDETGDDQFSFAVAKVVSGNGDRIEQYIDMVEENILREDLTFAEMAQVVLDAVRDPATGSDDPDVLVGRLYSAFHRTKKSYVRTFVALLTALDTDLKWPKAVPRNLGLDVARRLKEDVDLTSHLRERLSHARNADEQNSVLSAFSIAPPSGDVSKKRASASGREKLEFHSGDTKVTARNGECRIKSKVDFISLERSTLERAIAAFNAVISKG